VPRITKGDEIAYAAENADPQHKKGSHMEVLRIYSLEDYQSLIPGLWGIREPPREYDGKPRLNGEFVFSLIFSYHHQRLIQSRMLKTGASILCSCLVRIFKGRVPVCYSRINQVSHLMRHSQDLVTVKVTTTGSCRITLRWRQFEAGRCRLCVS
jgi:hypothetical protein